MKKKNDENISFGKRLKKLRESVNKSVNDVADFIEVAPSTYREWEQGRAVTGQPYLKLAAVLGVGVYEILGIQDQLKAEISQKLFTVESILREVRSAL